MAIENTWKIVDIRHDRSSSSDSGEDEFRNKNTIFNGIDYGDNIIDGIVINDEEWEFFISWDKCTVKNTRYNILGQDIEFSHNLWKVVPKNARNILHWEKKLKRTSNKIGETILNILDVKNPNKEFIELANLIYNYCKIRYVRTCIHKSEFCIGHHIFILKAFWYYSVIDKYFQDDIKGKKKKVYSNLLKFFSNEKHIKKKTRTLLRKYHTKDCNSSRHGKRENIFNW